ncbi:MAG: phage tail sheath subtilisin-like domain-containing protein [Clostridia bacterium]|nr:phage tail sheath subtilisin-like domain-containing protein [Clostridia bacterium]
MFQFNSTNMAPGVYMNEEAVPGPIQGVATGVAAFVGPAVRGPVNEPTPITSWTSFTEIFGGYIYSPEVYVTHAVRGFFENGGKYCYFVRVSSASKSSGYLKNKTNANILEITAKQEGEQGRNINIKVDKLSIAPNVQVVIEEAPLLLAKDNYAELKSENDLGKFYPGDVVTLINTAKDKTDKNLIITGIMDGRVYFNKVLSNAYADGSLKIADLSLGRKSIRIAASSGDGVEVGTYLQIGADSSQNLEICEVDKIEPIGKNFIRFIFKNELKKENLLDKASPISIKSIEFSITAGNEIIGPLSMNPRHGKYFVKANSDQIDIRLANGANRLGFPDNLPALPATATGLSGGSNESIAQIGPQIYKNAVDALERIEEVTILSVPDCTDNDVQSHMLLHCEKMGNRFAILDPVLNNAPDMKSAIAIIKEQRNNLGSDNGYGALYFPHIYASHPEGGRMKIPPSGHIAGLYARTDSTRGVHKAPANEVIKGVLDIERNLTDSEQGPLNELGINVIRTFPMRGAVIWGARTISTKMQWRYVNVRRLMLYIEESIKKATKYVVFEPNNRTLWATVKGQVTEFLTNVWRTGALVGATPADAFSVKIDEELNPPSLVAQGQLVIEVKLYPTTPAEYVVFNVIQQPGGPSVKEK